MRIILVTPAPAQSKNGNRVTARRWARLLRDLDCEVHIQSDYDNSDCDLLIGVHAFKSYASIKAFHELFPQRPLIVALAGTDLYGGMDQAETRASLEMASHLVLLQEQGYKELPPHLHVKTSVIIQSASELKNPPEKAMRNFVVCVLSHLRAVKDPLRTAHAARLLPVTSRVRVQHVGKALDLELGLEASREQAANPRYFWLGELPRWRAQRVLARAHVMVISSRSEGGANVVSEALVAGVPILASRVPGNQGLLGEDYPGYYSVGNSIELSRLIQRAEENCTFYEQLLSCCERLRSNFLPTQERAAWRRLLQQMMP